MKLEYIFAFFALLGVLDKIAGNRFKLGDEFEKGIMTIGPLVISMAGMIVLAPVMADGLTWIFKPILTPIGIDLSFIGAFFPVDAGGAVMAYEMSANADVRAYNGIIMASMFGATLCPVIPMALKMVDKKFHDDVLYGLLCGIATIPIGCVISGMIIGCTPMQLVMNTLPIILLGTAICFGLWKKPELVRRIFAGVGVVLTFLMMAGLAIGIIHKLTGIAVIPGIAPIDESFTIIGNIAIILSGVFPLIALISRALDKVFVKIGNVIGVDKTSVIGLVTSLANSIPVFSMMEKSNKKGRIMNMAFAVSGAYVFGDHLAFVLSFDRNYALAMVVGKLISGFMSLILVQLLYKRIAKE